MLYGFTRSGKIVACLEEYGFYRGGLRDTLSGGFAASSPKGRAKSVEDIFKGFFCFTCFDSSGK